MFENSPTTNPLSSFPRHEKAHPSGGVHLKDEAGSKGVLLNVLKGVGTKLKEGSIQDLLKMSRPAIISYHKTYLQCIANDFLYTEFMDAAVNAKNPGERMKYIAAFYIAGFHKNSCEMGSNGPLNPVLGESYITEKSDGTKLYCEQISHHPPVSAFYLTDKEGNYKLSGTGEVGAKLITLNSVEGKRTGKTWIDFKDGARVSVDNADMVIEGLIMGDRTINYSNDFRIVDTKNNITAEIKFFYNRLSTTTKWATGIKGWWSGTDPNKPLADTFSLTIFQLDDKGLKRELYYGGGSWLSFLELGGEIVWKVTEPVKETWSEAPKGRLLSDSSFRVDATFIKVQDYDSAQREKDTIENNQRADAKLRKAVKAEAEKAAKTAGKALG